MIWIKKKHIVFILIIIGLIGVSAYFTGFNLGKSSDISSGISFLGEWFPPNYLILQSSFEQSLVTLSIALLGTIFALIFSLPISFISAYNINQNRTSRLVSRFTLSFLRAIPEFIFGLILLTIMGTGATAAIIAIFIHNIGVFGKKISELVEASEPHALKAMYSVGAGKTTACCFGVIPQIFPNIISEYFYRFEVAFRASLVLGIIGGGGIGQQLMNHFQTFQYQSVCTDLIVIVILVITIDQISQYIRKRVI
jgi:phosphonate transport system permease protein